MPIIQPKIDVPDNIYKQYVSGNIEIKGLAKNAENHKVVKHLDTIEDSDSNNEDTDIIAFGVVALITLTAAITGITIKFINKAKQKKVENFKKCLNKYITSVNEQRLTVEEIGELIVAIDKLKKSVRKKVIVAFSTDELSSLIECLCNHTQTLAQANNVVIEEDSSFDEQSDVIIKLRNNLVYQKSIFDKVAWFQKNLSLQMMYLLYIVIVAKLYIKHNKRSNE